MYDLACPRGPPESPPGAVEGARNSQLVVRPSTVDYIYTRKTNFTPLRVHAATPGDPILSCVLIELIIVQPYIYCASPVVRRSRPQRGPRPSSYGVLDVTACRAAGTIGPYQMSHLWLRIALVPTVPCSC